MIITANVVDRTISVDNMSVVQNNVSIDTFLLTLDDEWNGVQSVKVVFYCKSATKEVQYQGGGIDIPWEITEYTDGFRITVVGYFANGDRLVTRKMKNFINVDESGLVEGEEAGEATQDAYQRIVEAAYAIEESANAAIEGANTAADSATDAAENANAAADAVSGQVSKLSADMDDISEDAWEPIGDYTRSYGKIIKSDGILVDYTASAGYWVSDPIPVEYPSYKYDCYMAWTNYLIAFYDSDGTLVGGFKETSGAIARYTGTIDTPVGATHVRFAGIYRNNDGDKIEGGRNFFYGLVRRLRENAVEYDDLGETLKNSIVPVFSDVELDLSINGYWSVEPDSRFYPYDSSLCTEKMPVTPGEILKITTSYYFSTTAYVFFNSQGEYMRGFPEASSGADTGMHDLTVTVPEGATHIAIGCISSHKAKTRLQRVNSYAAKAMPKIWSGKKWVCVGDSLTEVNARTTKHYHDYVNEVTGIEVVNMGVSGTGYKRTENDNSAFYQRVSNVPVDADVVTIFGSGNDCALIAQLGDASDTGTDTICGCINTTIDNLYSVNPTVQLGIITPTPWVNLSPSSEPNAMSTYSEKLVEICKRRGIPCLDLYHCSNLRPDDADFRQLAYSRDDGNGVHPDETGHALIAPKFNEFLRTLIRIDR